MGFCNSDGPCHSREFRQTIWSEPVEHNWNVAWIEKVKENNEHVEKQTDLDITAEDVKQALSQGCPTCGPGAACGSLAHLMRSRGPPRKIAQVVKTIIAIC